MEEQTINNINVKPQTLRKLASIQIINQINPHTNAEKLLLAMILGWQVVINKEENLKVGDKVIYFEIDSILPEGEEWSKFMEKCKYRVKTIKLRGELSQGLIIPLEKLFPKIDREFNEGDDLTNLLKLTKYDDEDIQILEGKSRVSNFPTEYGVSKTDEVRIQSSPSLLKEFYGKPYIATLKYDGTSSTFIYDDSKTEFIVCSRNQKLEESKEDLYWKTARKYNIEEILKKNPDFILQGEIYGPKINGNKLNVKEVKLVIFNVFSKELNKGLDYEELVSFCKVNSLEYASLMTSGDSFNESVSSLLEMVKGNYPNTNTPREGFVFRLKKNWDNSRRCSFKVINNDYLLKKDK
jgi:RNA ligase (TIGR02306 family)